MMRTAHPRPRRRQPRRRGRRLRQAGRSRPPGPAVGRQGQGRVRRPEARPGRRRQQRRRGQPGDRARRARPCEPYTDHRAAELRADPGRARPIRPARRSQGAIPNPGQPSDLPMNHFELQEGELACEDVPLSRDRRGGRHAGLRLFDRDAGAALHGVPRRADRAPRARRAADRLRAEGQLQRRRACARWRGSGAGADTVSEGEIRRALAAGVPAERIVFSGVGKTAGEMAFALEAGVAEINVESEPELDLLAPHRRRARACAPPIAIRVNPGRRRRRPRQDHHRPRREQVRRLARRGRAPLRQGQQHRRRCEPVGVACHIGSQITDLAPLARRLRADARPGRAPARRGPDASSGSTSAAGSACPTSTSPIRRRRPTTPPWSPRRCGGLDVQLAFEPGRVIAANAGVLLARVIHVHERPEGRRFLVLDAAMNDLIRPAMYDAYHDIRPVRPRPGAPRRLRRGRARSARPATPSPASGCCRRWRPATSSPS